MSVAWKFLSYYHTGFLFNLAMDSVKQFGVDEFTIRFFLSNQLPAQLGHFAIGMYLGNRYIAHKNGREKTHPWRCFIALTGFVSTVYSFHIANLAVPPWWHFWRLWLAFGSGYLIYLAAIDGPRVMRSFFSNRYLGYLGNLSYEIYLWHLMVLYVLTKIPLAQYIHGNRLRRQAVKNHPQGNIFLTWNM
jgi:peptidoglycan/LPS O-acetylase OafA/YrhL